MTAVRLGMLTEKNVQLGFSKPGLQRALIEQSASGLLGERFHR